MTTVVNCPKCAQKLRIPDDGRVLEVVCSTCQNKWKHSPKNIFQKDILDVAGDLREDMSEFLKILKGARGDGRNMSVEEEERVEKQLKDVLTYHPRVGILGKTGSGKSSLCNAIFGSDTAKVDDVKGCTRSPQEILINLGKNQNITLIDVPGVGENSERDVEYRELYKQLLPELDIVVWVVKADDRALTVDQIVVMEDLKPLLENKPFVVAINQVDKLNPIDMWKKRINKPCIEQQADIDEKSAIVAKFFDVTAERVVPVSAYKKYNLDILVEAMVFALPASKKVGLFREVKEEYRSEKAKKEAKKGFLDTVIDMLEKTTKIYDAVAPYIPTIIAVGTKLFNLFMKKK